MGSGISHIPGADAVFGKTDNPNSPAVSGVNDSTKANGFLAGPNPLSASQPIGACGQSDTIGVFGFGTGDSKCIGVHGNTAFGKGTGVWGNSTDGNAVLGTCNGNGLAGRFEGHVFCTGHIDAPKGTITCFDVAIANGDCAEEFDLTDAAAGEPGTVMCLDHEGAIRPSCSAYDKKVAGVISGAGDYKPGIVLDRQNSRGNRAPLALLGKVYCRVDAEYAPIEIGDLLTTSPTVGHAMKAQDSAKAFGAVIGKALRPLKAGRGLIPVLIALQ
jgi:hypothetical protein